MSPQLRRGHSLGPVLPLTQLNRQGHPGGQPELVPRTLDCSWGTGRERPSEGLIGTRRPPVSFQNWKSVVFRCPWHSLS